MIDKHEEYIAIVDSNDQVIRKAIRREVHTNGEGKHRVACVLVFNSEGEILIQKRSAIVEKYPNCWTVSSAGHVTYGDSYIITAVRELHEEIGVKTSEKNLELLGKINIPLVDDDEVWEVYKLITDQKEFKMQPEEVSEVKLISLNRLKQMIDDPKGVVCERARILFDHFLFKNK